MTLAKTWIGRAVIAASLAVIAATAVDAMRVSPMVVEMESSGGNATARVEVQNLNKSNLAFETRVTQAVFDGDGAIAETPRDEDFLVFPPQGVLPTQGRQVIRLQWVGGALDSSRAYYLSVNQLPVQLEENTAAAAGAQVQILYHMKALVVVAPPGATPNVSVAAAQGEAYQPPAETQGGPLPAKVPGIAITLKNTGKRHAMMAGLTWIVEGKDVDGEMVRLVLSPEDLNKVIGTGYVAAVDGVRTFRIPTPGAFAPGPLSVRFQQQ